MRRILMAGLLLMAVTFGTTAQKKKDVLLTIDKQKIAQEDFMRIYKRNNNNIQDSVNKKTAIEYLQLFINFKLKVIESQHLGMDTAKAFREELAGYRTELASPYLTDNSFNDKVIEDTYQRMIKELNASHIMIRLAEDPSPEDTLTAFKKITEIRDLIEKGLDFNDAAKQYSQDPSAETNRGDLGWFTVFQMVYPFENMAYSTRVGQVSPPFRTKFGYHILKVQNIRNAEGEIHVAHIMKMYPQNATPEQKLKALHSIDSLFTLIQKGADFAELAKQYSDDQRSAEKGGEMPWFSRNKMMPEFANPSFALTKDGEISKPIDSGFGYHIIKRLGLKPVPPYEEVKAELTERLKHDKDRVMQSQDTFLAKLKKEYNFNADQPAIDDVLKATRSWLSKEKPQIPSLPEKEQVLFSFAQTSIKTGNWIEFLKKSDISTLSPDSVKILQHFTTFENESVINWEDSHLEEKHPDFRSLMDEYHDGMLLFDISEKKIWQRASSDTTGLEKFYETNKQKYLWPERFKGMVVQCFDPGIRDEVEGYLEMGIPVNEVSDMLHLRPGSITARTGAWAKNEDAVVDYYYWNGPRPADWSPRTGFLSGKLVPPEPKLLNEVRGYHIADYQQYLEDQWIKDLRKKYSVKINKKLLKKMSNE
jgi:peptidyl-prolyl cis-trans isomerase SurA